MVNSLFELINGKKKTKKVIRDYKQEILNRQGRKQFKKMIERGIELPVVPL